MAEHPNVLLIEGSDDRMAQLAGRLCGMGVHPVSAQTLDDAIRVLEERRQSLSAALFPTDLPVTDLKGALESLRKAGLLAGCTTPAPLPPELDFAKPSSWAWLVPQSGPWGTANPELDRILRQSIEAQLAARGCLPSRGEPPDLFVIYRVELRHSFVIRNESSALETLYSLHDSPSYEIQRVVEVARFYQHAELTVVVADGADRRKLWQGRASKRARHSFTPHAAKAVARAFRSWPTRGEASPN